MKTIAIGNVKLPLEDFVISRSAILGITNSGKTYAAKGLAEQLMDASVPIIVFDAIGVWRWLKVPAEGGKGYPIVVAGGAAPDLPLTVQSAPEIVRAALKSRVSLVVDLYDPKLSKGDWRRIVQQCFHVLLFENEAPLHIFLEEASEYVPQVSRDTDGATFAAVEKVARMGGNARLGLTLINQRAQEVSKSVLELCDNLLLFRQRGANAIGTLEKWVDRLEPRSAKEIASKLPNLETGECYVMTGDDAVVRTKTRQLSSLHPDRRSNVTEINPGKAVDVGEFVSRMSGELTELIKQAKADDPKALWARIADLEQQLASPSKTFNAEAVDTIRRDFHECLDGLKETLSNWADSTGRRIDSGFEHMLAFEALPVSTEVTPTHRRSGMSATSWQAYADLPKPPRTGERSRPKENPPRTDSKFAPSNPESEGRGSLGKAERLILTVAAQHYPKELPRSEFALHVGYHARSKGFLNALGKLHSSGLLVGTKITQDGFARLGDFERIPPKGAARVAWYCANVLTPAQGSMLRKIVMRTDWDQQALAGVIGVHPRSKGFLNNLGRLRGLGLVVGVRAVEALES